MKVQGRFGYSDPRLRHGDYIALVDDHGNDPEDLIVTTRGDTLHMRKRGECEWMSGYARSRVIDNVHPIHRVHVVGKVLCILHLADSFF